jgi:hypothetical protein
MEKNSTVKSVAKAAELVDQSGQRVRKLIEEGKEPEEE